MAFDQPVDIVAAGTAALLAGNAQGVELAVQIVEGYGAVTGHYSRMLPSVMGPSITPRVWEKLTLTGYMPITFGGAI